MVDGCVLILPKVAIKTLINRRFLPPIFACKIFSTLKPDPTCAYYAQRLTEHIIVHSPMTDSRASPSGSLLVPLPNLVAKTIRILNQDENLTIEALFEVS